MKQPMDAVWKLVGDLFTTDDGSLPDIYVDSLTNEEVVKIYNWVLSQTTIYAAQHEPTLWHREKQQDVPIRTLDNPALLVTNGHADSFRHGLTLFAFSGNVIPQLTIAVSPNDLEFDYRMGSDWGPTQITAFFEFLWAIQEMAPNANIWHTHEGGSTPSTQFMEAWKVLATIKRAR